MFASKFPLNQGKVHKIADELINLQILKNPLSLRFQILNTQRLVLP